MSQPPPSSWPATPPPGPPAPPPGPPVPPPAPVTAGAGAGGAGPTAIHDTGYQHYHGPRGGLMASMRPVVVLSAQRVLGLRRPARAKIIPVATAFFSYVPAIVFVGMAVLIPDELRAEVMSDDARMYADYYGSIVAALVLFTAFSAPDILCPDRRTGMLGLYLASPLDRDHYLAAKATAVGLVLAIVTVGPPLFLLVAYLIAGTGPDTPADAVVLLVRVVVAGAAVSALYAVLSMAAASLTTRHAAASAGIVVTLLGSSFLSAVLVDSGASDLFGLLDVLGLPLGVVLLIYGETITETDHAALASLAPGVIVGAYLAWTLALAAFVRTRYQRLDVTR